MAQSHKEKRYLERRGGGRRNTFTNTENMSGEQKYHAKYRSSQTTIPEKIKRGSVTVSRGRCAITQRKTRMTASREKQERSERCK